MGRQLRPRRSKANYAAALAAFDSEDENDNPVASSSAAIDTLEDPDSGSDFNPEKNKNGKDNNDEEEEDEDEDEDADAEGVDDITDEEVEEEAPKPTRSAETKTPPAKGKQKAKAESASVGPPPAKRQMYALPARSVHHRHRAVPLYSREGRVERLTSRPRIFGAPSTSLTNCVTENSKISDRVNKSWGYNIGSGPLWDLAEDRGWYKEAITTADDADTEANRRPRVYSNLKVVQHLEVISIQDAAPYLPTDDVTTTEGNLQPPPALPCYFGPIKKQTLEIMNMFESIPMSKYFSESKALVFNAGAPVWGMDWCPIHPEDRAARSYKQYLAVAPFPSRSHSPDIGKRVARPSYACIQIWSLSSLNPSKPNDDGQMKCEMVLCLDTGPAYDLKWCPLPSHDLKNDTTQGKKLGLLGGTFEDGSFSLFVVPEPSNFASPEGDDQHPLSNPLLRIELEQACCWSFDWANSEVIAIGTTNGAILVYDIGSALRSYGDFSQPTIVDLLPTYYLLVHQSAVRALSWIRAPPCSSSGTPAIDQDPIVIASAGYDGMECLTDIREGRGSVMNRTRDVINALAFSPFAGGPITMDHENTVKAYSASPSMLGRGHSLFEPLGPIWSVHASDFHPQLAVGASDGTLSTTNMLRSTRRGGSVPFFVHKIFQMDYNRITKEYRMLDHFLPQESIDRPTATRAAKGKSKKDAEVFPPSTGAWPREVGVHRVVWNNGNGLASSGMIAAGTSSGLCRVDLLWGRWVKDKIPYGSVSGIRMEDGDAMEVDSDEDASGDDSD
ncbi:Transcription factor tau subunit sfc6 [Psilocybe cubensis]|uniref:Transcription factor tau subunit sfc6 n=1 Tax=Psilocybe cubensis TaxID=181762 RepID=A0ACB8H955_PSICU|nr:Transcription factor tau subunit sfc6 [Psilocybe cubensis]KAH9484533.1 Transcription factor tau subunit sfc6 [Psilocybe cubensis]